SACSFVSLSARNAVSTEISLRSRLFASGLTPFGFFGLPPLFLLLSGAPAGLGRCLWGKGFMTVSGCFHFLWSTLGWFLYPRSTSSIAGASLLITESVGLSMAAYSANILSASRSAMASRHAWVELSLVPASALTSRRRARQPTIAVYQRSHSSPR